MEVTAIKCMKFNKAKSKVLKLGLGLCNSAEKDTRALVKQKLNMSQQCTLAAINYCNTGLYQQESAKGSREAISVLNAREATSGTHCSVFNTPVHERDGYAGERPVEGH